MLRQSFQQFVGICLFLSIPITVVGQSADGLASRPLAGLSGSSPAHLFTAIDAKQAGIDFLNPIDLQSPLKRLYVTGYGGGSIAIGDVNGDELADVYFVSGPRANRLYLQKSPFMFEDVTEASGVSGGSLWGTGAAMADVDNDGDLDIYVCNYLSPSQLYVNDGSGKFADQAKSAGLDFSGTCMMPSFADYDGDGKLDLFLLNHQLLPEGGPPKEQVVDTVDGIPVVQEKWRDYVEVAPLGDNRWAVREHGLQDKLYRNTGNTESLAFTDVTAKAGLRDVGMGLAVLWWDYNEDGRPDIYVANDFAAADNLWMNNGDGTFTDKLAETFPHTSWFSMGADIADINNDGHWDMLVADMAGSNHFRQKLAMGSMNNDRIFQVLGPPPQLMRNALLIGTGTNRFLEAAFLAGVASTDWTWAVKFADFDNDGLEDLYFTNGMTRDFMDSDILAKSPSATGTEWQSFEHAAPRAEQNIAFKNAGDLQFRDTSKEWGLADSGVSFAAAHGDLDRDGDLDMIVMNLDAPPSIYRNDSSSGNRVTFELRGAKSNRFAIGAVVTVKTGDTSRRRVMLPVTGFNSSNEPLLHFGLGDAAAIEQVTVHWPSGAIQQFAHLAVNKHYTLTETDAKTPAPATPKTKAFYSDVPLLTAAKLAEQEFDEFKAQSLLPNMLSRLGPGIAWGDIDGDGRDDIFVGAPRGKISQLFAQSSAGTFAAKTTSAFAADATSEDMGAVFIDADSDGDRDLYVVSGGVESTRGSAEYQDRLYLNDGAGNFSTAPADALPSETESGSVAAAADYDRDGLVDLFVGGRVTPLKYPTSSNNLLLKNTSAQGKAKFESAIEAAAPGLASQGLVTSALWSDIDNDGWLDLLLTREWGPLTVWKNNNGKLTEATGAAGIANLTGWWNGIAAGDFDSDGDIDYAATNFGLNTKYHASEETPTLLYYGDFKGNAEGEIIEAEYEDETLFPVRGRGCSSRAMPHLKEKFGTFREFAQASLPEIYSPQSLSSAQRFAATTLESGVFLNDGKGRFVFKALPRLAQISPGYGIVATEANGDGLPDLVLAQNFYGPQIETGRMDSGLSLLLLGDGTGSFNPVWPADSGIVIASDAKSLTTVDLNRDGQSDLAFGLNNEGVKTLQSAAPSEGFLSVRLSGPKGNLDAAGARVTLVRTDGKQQTAELYSGGSYLGQSAPEVFFGLGASAKPKQIVVRWSDGTTQEVDLQSVEPKLLQKRVVVDYSKQHGKS